MLSQGTGYAATALAFVAAAGGRPVLVREMAEAAEVPAPYLAKLIHMLGRRGLVQTQRGIGGGVTLARPADQITLRDLCEALADPVLLHRCMLGTAECSDERACPAHKFWAAQRGRIHEFLGTTTVADVAAFETRRRWRGLREREDAAREEAVGGGPTDGAAPAAGSERRARITEPSRTPTDRSSDRRRG